MKCVEFLLHEGTDVARLNHFSQHALFYAAIRENNTLNLFLSKELLNVNKLDTDENNVLHGVIRETYMGPFRITFEL